MVNDDVGRGPQDHEAANASRWAEDHSLLRPKRVQVHGYAAGLVDAGDCPETATVRIVTSPLTARSPTGGRTRSHSTGDSRRGVDRLEGVRPRMAAGESLPKDKRYE